MGVANAGSTSNLAQLTIAEDRFYNYDFISQSVSSSNVDWPISMVFHTNAEIDKVKDIFFGAELTANLMYGRVNDGNGYVWDEDRGTKSGQRYSSQLQTYVYLHMRLYAPNPPDYMQNDDWGNFVIGSTHYDQWPFETWSGYSEYAEDDFVDIGRSKGYSVADDWADFFNNEPFREEGSHIWLNNGRGTEMLIKGGLNVYAEDCAGNYISGMAVNVYNSQGTLIKSGYTPMYVDIVTTGNYLVKYNNYGSNVFVSGAPLPAPVTSYTKYGWGGDVNISLSSDGTHDVDGIYNTSGGSSCGTTGEIKVRAERKFTDQPIDGLYVQLTNSQGQEIANGFTPVTFTQSAGTYTAYPNDFAPYYFDHWEDNGSTIRGRTVNLSADQHWELVAVYRVQ